MVMMVIIIMVMVMMVLALASEPMIHHLLLIPSVKVPHMLPRVAQAAVEHLGFSTERTAALALVVVVGGWRNFPNLTPVAP